MLGSMEVGLKALQANQVALQTVGHNIANVATPGYSRQEALLRSQVPPNQQGIPLGRGVEVESVVRSLDSLLERRIQENYQSLGRLEEKKSGLEQLEEVVNPRISDLLPSGQKFLSELQRLTQSPEDPAQRRIFLLSAEAVSVSFREHLERFEDIMQEIGDKIKLQVEETNRLTSEIAQANRQLLESGKEKSPDGLDRRDQLLGELSRRLDTRVHWDDQGNAQVIAGNRLLVDGKRAFALETVEEGESLQVRYQGSQEAMTIRGGSVRGLLDLHENTIPTYQDRLDTLAKQWIERANTMHSTGIGLQGMGELRSSKTVADPTAPLNSQGLSLKKGEWKLTIREKDTGSEEPFNVSLDPEVDSLQKLAGTLDGHPRLSANVTQDNRLEIRADQGFVFAFTTDTTDGLPALQLNSLFTGSGAKDIAVSGRLLDDPQYVSLAQSFAPGDNRQGLKLLQELQDTPQDNLEGQTLLGYWSTQVTRVGEETQIQRSQHSATAQFAAELETRRSSTSGVSLEEEWVKLNQYQFSYQAAARVVQTTNEMMDTVIRLGQ